MILRFGLLFVLLFGAIRVFSQIWPRFRDPSAASGPQPFLYKVARHKGRVTGIEIGIEVPDRLRFALRRENVLDRIGKWLGLAREFQSGDESFDDALFVVGEAPALANLLAIDANWRASALSIMRLPDAKRIDCESSRLWVTLGKPLDDRGEDDEDDDARIAAHAASRVLEPLIRCRERLASLTLEAWSDENDPATQHARLLNGVMFALAVAGLAAFFLGEFKGSSVPRMLVWDRTEICAWVAALVSGGMIISAAVYLLRGSSRLHLIVMEVLVSAMPGTWFASRALVADYNMRADRSTERVEQRIVEHLRESRSSKGGPRYYVTFDRTPDGFDSAEVQVTRRLYDRARMGECARVFTRHGALGDRWLARIDLDGGFCEGL